MIAGHTRARRGIRAHVATAAIPDVDDVVVASAHEDFTIRAPTQPTHLARVPLERRDGQSIRWTWPEVRICLNQPKLAT